MEDVVKTVVVKREDGVSQSTMASTPPDQPNVLIHALSPLRVVVVRSARVYMQSFIAFLTTGMSGISKMVLPDAVAQVMPQDLWGLVILAAQIAVAPAFVTLVQNIGELLMRMDEKAPQWRP